MYGAMRLDGTVVPRIVVGWPMNAGDLSLTQYEIEISSSLGCHIRHLRHAPVAPNSFFARSASYYTPGHLVLGSLNVELCHCLQCACHCLVDNDGMAGRVCSYVVASEKGEAAMSLCVIASKGDPTGIVPTTG